MELLLYYGLLGCLVLLVLASTALRLWTGGSVYDIAHDVIYGSLAVAAVASGLLIGARWLETHGPALAGLW